MWVLNLRVVGSLAVACLYNRRALVVTNDMFASGGSLILRHFDSDAAYQRLLQVYIAASQHPPVGVGRVDAFFKVRKE